MDTHTLSLPRNVHTCTKPCMHTQTEEEKEKKKELAEQESKNKGLQKHLEELNSRQPMEQEEAIYDAVPICDDDNDSDDYEEIPPIPDRLHKVTESEKERGPEKAEARKGGYESSLNSSKQNNE